MGGIPVDRLIRRAVHIRGEDEDRIHPGMGNLGQMGVGELVQSPPGMRHARREQWPARLVQCRKIRPPAFVEQVFQKVAGLGGSPVVAAAKRNPARFGHDPVSTSLIGDAGHRRQFGHGSKHDDVAFGHFCQVVDPLQAKVFLHADLEVVLQVTGDIAYQARRMAVDNDSPASIDRDLPLQWSGIGVALVGVVDGFEVPAKGVWLLGHEMLLM
jgi:hypothetical protein